MYGLTYGLEKEFFIKDAEENIVIVPASLPMDSSGLLVEARGKPNTNIYQAVYSLEGEMKELVDKVRVLKLTPHFTDYEVISRPLRAKVNRQFEKGRTTFQNLYGHEYHRNPAGTHTAGVHISFTLPTTVSASVVVEGRTHTARVEVFKTWDWARLFIGLDKAFKEEIKAAKRNPGFYELKADGRIEYRSLPVTVDMEKVINTVKKLVKEL